VLAGVWLPCHHLQQDRLQFRFHFRRQAADIPPRRLREADRADHGLLSQYFLLGLGFPGLDLLEGLLDAFGETGNGEQFHRLLDALVFLLRHQNGVPLAVLDAVDLVLPDGGLEQVEELLAGLGGVDVGHFSDSFECTLICTLWA